MMSYESSDPAQKRDLRANRKVDWFVCVSMDFTVILHVCAAI